MIFKIAFKNIWRNKLRSWTVIIAIALGIFGGLAVISTATGLSDMRQRNAIKTYVSHIQIHDSNYLKYSGLKDLIASEEEVISYIQESDQVEGVSARLRIESFIQSAGGTSGVVLNGIDPEAEKQVTDIAEMLQAGNYLADFKRKPPILISKKLATKLNAKIKTTIQCSFTDANGQPATGVFKVVDIFTTSNSMYDEMNAFVRLEDLQSISRLYGSHEIALTLKDEELVEQYRENLMAKFPGLHIASWRGIAPELGYADK
ncbi:MAG: putative ABC transport system permease protein, partial [Lentimonas sp.]